MFQPTKRPFDYGNNFTSAGQQAWGTGATSNQGDGQQESERKKKRKSRWAQETELEKTIIPGMPTVIPTGLSMDQEKQYLCKFNYQAVNGYNIHVYCVIFSIN